MDQKIPSEWKPNTVFTAHALKGKKILLTGASSGIGAATAVQLAACGASLILVGRNEQKLSKVLSTLSTSNHEIYSVDLSKPDSLYSFIKALPSHTLPLHGAFHSAGCELVKPARLTKASEIEEIITCSVGAGLSLARAIASKGIMLNGGSLIFMSSVSALAGTAGMSAYSASKGAVDAMSRSLAAELAPRQIRVNTIISGAIKTPMHERLTNSMTLESVQDYQNRHPLGFGDANDIAQVVAFLMSSGGRWITGTSIVVDGGYLSV